MIVWQFTQASPRSSWTLPCQIVRWPRSWQARQIPFFSSELRGSSASNDMMPPTPRPPPAAACAEPGPWQFSQANLPGWVMLMRPIRVFLNSAVWVAWQPTQTLSPTMWASGGGRLPLATAAFRRLGRRSGFLRLGQPVHQIVRFGHLGLALERRRLGGVHALRERFKRAKSPVVELGSLRRLGAGCLRRIDLLRVGGQRRQGRIAGDWPARLAGFFCLGGLRPGRQCRIDARDREAALGLGRLRQIKCGAK